MPFGEPDDVEADWRLLALAATAADRLGSVEPFSRRLFAAVFVDGVSLLDAAACRRLAQRARLDQSLYPAGALQCRDSPDRLHGAAAL